MNCSNCLSRHLDELCDLEPLHPGQLESEDQQLIAMTFYQWVVFVKINTKLALLKLNHIDGVYLCLFQPTRTGQDRLTEDTNRQLYGTSWHWASNFGVANRFRSSLARSHPLRRQSVVRLTLSNALALPVEKTHIFCRKDDCVASCMAAAMA